MNKVRALYKAFGSNLEMPKPDGEKKKKLYTRFGLAAFIGIMVPVSVIVGYITYILTDLLFVFDGNSYGLLSELDLISAFAMIFGMPLMFSVLFFSSDLQFLTALPVSSASLYSARFWHTFKAENVMTSNILFAIYIGYFVSAAKNTGIANALNPVAVLASVVGFYGSLLVPLIYCSVIALVLMLVLKRFKRTDIYFYSSLALFIAFTLLFLLSFRSYGRISVSDYLDSLVLSNNSFITVCNFLFPTNYLTTLAIRTHSVIPLAASLGIIAGLYLISVLTAHLIYRKGLFAAFIAGNKKVSGKTDSVYKSRSVFKSLVIKEIRVLMRTMTYRMNCVYANLLWPAAAVIFIIEAPKLEFIKIFSYKLQSDDPLSRVILFAVFIAAAFIASGLNSIASTSFTREGVHIDMLKYLPADLGKQIKAKLFIALLFTYIPIAVAITPVTIYLKDTVFLPLYLLISFACILTASVIGILMDSFSPYTVWSDELSALRGNLNCFFNLAAEMVAALVTGGISYGLFKLSGSSLITITVVTAFLIIAGVVSVTAGLPQTRKNIAGLVS
jgi:ABC-2 type transport system permease protein